MSQFDPILCYRIDNNAILCNAKKMRNLSIFNKMNDISFSSAQNANFLLKIYKFDFA